MTCLRSHIQVEDMSPEAPSGQTPESEALFTISNSIYIYKMLCFFFISQTIPRILENKKILYWAFYFCITFYCYVTNYHKMKFSGLLGSYSLGRNAHHLGILGEIVI